LWCKLFAILLYIPMIHVMYADAGEEPMETDDVGNTEENTPQAEEIVHDDGVFTVRIGPSSTNQVSR